MIFVNDEFESVDDTLLQQTLSHLPAWRREMALKYKHRDGMLQCCYSYLLADKALTQVFGIPSGSGWEYSQQGKPFLRDYPDVHFNISHCRGAVACIVDTVPVGIDIENIRPVRDSLLNYAFNDNEIQLIKSAVSPDVEFTRLWTMKESLFKLRGSGITHDIKTILNDIGDIVFEARHNEAKGYILTAARQIIP